jgi:hypothetical protein
LKSKVSNFGSKLDLPEDFIKKSIIIIWFSSFQILILFFSISTYY